MYDDLQYRESVRRVISMGGFSDSGKTTIAAWIIEKFSALGKKVVYIKNIPHDDLSLDSKGKDTDRAFRAGAKKVIGRTPTRIFSLERNYLGLMDIVNGEDPNSIIIVEGFHSEIGNIGNFLGLYVSKHKEDEGLEGSFVKAEIELEMPGTSPIRLSWPADKDHLFDAICRYIES